MALGRRGGNEADSREEIVTDGVYSVAMLFLYAMVVHADWLIYSLGNGEMLEYRGLKLLPY